MDSARSRRRADPRPVVVGNAQVARVEGCWQRGAVGAGGRVRRRRTTVKRCRQVTSSSRHGYHAHVRSDHRARARRRGVRRSSKFRRTSKSTCPISSASTGAVRAEPEFYARAGTWRSKANLREPRELKRQLRGRSRRAGRPPPRAVGQHPASRTGRSRSQARGRAARAAGRRHRAPHGGGIAATHRGPAADRVRRGAGAARLARRLRGGGPASLARIRSFTASARTASRSSTSPA